MKRALVLAVVVFCATPASADSTSEVQALKAIDESNPKSVDAAVKAADTLGAKPAPEAMPALVELAKKPATKKLIAAQISAIRALGKYPGAGKALADLIDRDPPGKKPETEFTLHLARTGAAINAIAELRAPEAIPALVKGLVRTPELFMQSRRALLAIGPKAERAVRAMLRGENKAVNKLAVTTPPTSARDFYAAIVIGDFHDAAAVNDLLAATKRPALPAYYADDQPGPSSQINAIYDSLRKIGAPEAAPAVRAAWMQTKTLETRILAVAAYPFVARNDADVAALGKIAADNTADDSLRQEAATAFARLAHDAKSIEILDALAKKYFDASAGKRKEADLKKPDADAADKTFAAAKAKGGDISAAQKAHKDAVLPFKQLDSAAKAYLGYARMFQSHIARVEVAIRCKDDLACYGATLKLTAADAAKNLAPYIKDLADWTADEKLGLLEGNVERAMLELGKRGAKAADQTDALLDAAASTNRIIRQSILLALPKIAKLPCPTCVTKLDAAIKAGEGKTELGDLTMETQVARNYFLSAGQK